MMWEVEVKVRCAHSQVLSLLHELGAINLGDTHQRDSYYSHPGRDFASSDEALRIREQGETVELTYKGPRQPGTTKTREELSFRIDNANTAHQVLSRLGFTLTAIVEKRRRTFQLEDAMVCLDTVQGLGEFVEVEARCSESGELQDVGESQEYVLSLLDKLCLPPSTETRSYLELILEKKK